MEFLTVNETAALLKLAPVTIRRYIAAGRLPAVRVGRGVRVNRSAIAAFAVPVAPRGDSSHVPDEAGEDSENLLLQIIRLGREEPVSGERSNIASDKYAYLAEVHRANEG